MTFLLEDTDKLCSLCGKRAFVCDPIKPGVRAFLCIECFGALIEAILRRKNSSAVADNCHDGPSADGIPRIMEDWK